MNGITQYVVFCDWSLSQDNVFKVLPYHVMNQYLVLLWPGNIPCYLSINQLTLFFSIAGVLNKAGMNIHAQVYLWP